MIVALLAAFLAVATGAQQPTVQPSSRPKVALVFEGGGALGFAHIGVIEWIEAHHIPVDYVAGTSMGGLVGGLYASGMSPQEIANFVGGINWTAVLSGQVPFPALSYRRKEDKLAFPNRLEFGLKHGFSLPSGLNSGSRVGLLLDEKMLPYYDLQSFDDLPIPFRCVATDMTTGREHVFKDGSLSQAMRSTMSIPGVFAPVEHGTQVYSDGAAVNNLPVNVARAMGADIVIAVYLDTGPFDKKSLSSLVGVAGRNVQIMVAANELNSMKDANILLKADVSKFTATEFEKSAEIIPQGVKVAQEHAAELEKYAVSDADWQAYVTQRNSRRRTALPVPQFVDIYGMHGVLQTQIANEFTQYVNKPIDTQQIEKTIVDLQGTGLYTSISYNLIDKDDKTGLLVRPRLKDYGPPFLNVGLFLSSNNVNDIQLGLGARATFFGMAGPGSELRVNASVGQLAGVSGELYKPLFVGKGYFVAPRAYYAHAVSAYYSGSQQLAQYTEERNGFGVDLGYQFSSKVELRVGEDYQWYGETLRIGTPIEQAFHITPLVSSAQFQYLGQDSVQVPTRGTEIRSLYTYSTQSPNSSEGYSQLDTKISHFIPVRSRGIILGIGEGGTSFGATNLGLAGFSLGGPLRLSAYEQGELLGNDYFLAQAGYLHQLFKLNPVIGDAVYAGGIYEIGKVWGAAPGTPSLPYDVAGALVVKTLIGPIYGGVSVGDGGHHAWFFGLGRIF
ncbi:MAG TPA: patatin-like phospholipase family protein [Edaphobacter sp.]|nr:patatin-like phospholipase family protein [Edaphobacter sp.]